MTISNDQTRPELRWEFHHFDSLDTRSLFDLIKLRVDVFVVEQACAYPELDEADTHPQTVHLLGFSDETLVAYARAMPGGSHHHDLGEPESDPGADSEFGAQLTAAVRIGRVVVASAWRGRGLATSLMQQMMAHLQRHHAGRNQCLAAQENVQAFYASLGFVAVSGVYLEDGIPHIDMLRQVEVDAEIEVVDGRTLDSATPTRMMPKAT